jgi:membrane protease YdiL (CAAX protease family)/TolA-binding protein
LRTFTLGSTLRGSLLTAALCSLGGGAVLADGTPPSSDPEILLRQARTLKEYRDCRAAVRVSASLIREFPQSPAAQKATEILDVCLPELRKSEIEELASDSEVRPVAARAMLVMASSHTSQDDCTGAIKIFDRVAALYPNTPEAWRASTRKAVSCLDRNDRHREAVETLQRVVKEADHSPEAAYALYWLAQVHKNREERDEARVALTRLIRDYPPEFEYPSSPGLKIVKYARTDLKMLDYYMLGPLLDGIASRILRALYLDRSSPGKWRDRISVILIPSLQFGAEITALVLTLLALGLVRKAGLTRPKSGLRLFENNWSLVRVSTLLMLLWGVSFLFQATFLLVYEASVPDAVRHLLGTQGDWSLDLGISGVALLACLWRERIRQVFLVGRRSLRWVAGGLALFIAYVCAGGALRRVILWASGRTTEPVLPNSSGDFSTAGMAMVTVVTIVLAAAAEECVYRGVLYEAFGRLSNGWVAALLSSVLFGAAHVKPFGYLITLTLMGLLLVYLREKSGSLFVPLTLHVLNNLLVALAHTFR